MTVLGTFHQDRFSEAQNLIRVMQKELPVNKNNTICVSRSLFNYSLKINLWVLFPYYKYTSRFCYIGHQVPITWHTPDGTTSLFTIKCFPKIKLVYRMHL